MAEGLNVSGMSEEEKIKLGEEKMTDTEAAMSKSREETHEFYRAGESNITKRLEQQKAEEKSRKKREFIQWCESLNSDPQIQVVVEEDLISSRYVDLEEVRERTEDLFESAPKKVSRAYGKNWREKVDKVIITLTEEFSHDGYDVGEEIIVKLKNSEESDLTYSY